MKIKILVAVTIAVLVCAYVVKAEAPAEKMLEVIVIDNRAQMIDAYMSKRHMPLAGYGAEFVREADKNGIDWWLLAAISVQEQSGGKILPYNCPNKTKNYNFAGWASAKVCFTSFSETIVTVSAHLGGNKSGTARYYGNKTTEQKLKMYNPFDGYTEKIYSIGKAIQNS